MSKGKKVKCNYNAIYTTDLSTVRTIKETRGKKNVYEAGGQSLSRIFWLSRVERFLTTLFRRANINDFVENLRLCRKAPAVRLFETAAPGNWLLPFVEAAYYSFRQRGSRNSLNGIERVCAWRISIFYGGDYRLACPSRPNRATASVVSYFHH